MDRAGTLSACRILYLIGLAVSSSCIWRFEEGSSDEKMTVGFLSGTMTGAFHFTWRITGAGTSCASAALLTSAVTIRVNWPWISFEFQQSIFVPTSTKVNGVGTPTARGPLGTGTLLPL